MGYSDYSKRPWMYSYKGAKSRCNLKTHVKYAIYGGRGIKFLMTEEDFKFIWNRDNAQEMQKPSIDRIDSDGDYVLANCRYIEFKDNASRPRIARTPRKKHAICKRGHKREGDNLYVTKSGHASCRACVKIVRRKISVGGDPR